MTRSPSARTAAVVFDLDGTLLDTMTLAPTAYADTIRSLGGPDLSPSEVVAGWHIGPTPVVLGIFASATGRAATLVLCAAGLDGVFPTVICCDEISEPKPAPEGLWLACQYLGVSAAVTAYVRDAEVDLQCVEVAGSVAVHAGWGATTTAAEDFPLVAYRPSDVIELLLRQAFKGIRHPQARE